MELKTIEEKFLDAFKLQYKNEFNYDEYPNEHIRMWFMQGYELAKKELEEQLKEAENVIAKLDEQCHYRVDELDKYREKWK